RMQGAYLSEDEVERVVEYVKTLGEPEYIDDEIFIDEDDDTYGQEDLEDPLMEQAIEVVVSANKASASYLQRRLKIGYNRAARLVEEMERIGIVGPQNGSKPRDIISH
ncbi:MAG: DNA translocase FtsK, partial [Alkalispirochaetaceae bacterium]